LSAKKTTTHTLIEGELTIALRERSSVWQCRYCVDGKWQRNTTNERDLKKAKERAKDIYKEAIWKQKNNVAPITRFFRDIAKAVVKKLKQDLNSGNGKTIYNDYINAIEKYLIPILGKYKVDSIDYKALEYLNEKRIEKMGKQPTKSTLLNHNAALNKVFDLAIDNGYMSNSSKPQLIAKGKKSERREEFSVEEVIALRSNFESWIERGREDTKQLRALLRDYVEILLDTGARPGKELLDLKWAQVSVSYDPKLIGVSKAQPSEDNEHGEDIEAYDLQRTAIIRIESGKTGKRTAIGREDTVRALGRIANRNYNKTLAEAIEDFGKDYIFRYKEFTSKKRGNLQKDVKLIAPTSFVKLFNSYLKEHNLLIDSVSGKKRQPYSLRHTYATLMLTHDKVSPHTLAKQMGTSIAMIEKHYSHLDAIKAINQLRGEESRQLIQADKSVGQKYAFKEKAKKKK
jgi:integrase